MIQAARVADDDETDSFRRWLEAEPADEVADDLDALRAHLGALQDADPDRAASSRLMESAATRALDISARVRSSLQEVGLPLPRALHVVVTRLARALLAIAQGLEAEAASTGPGAAPAERADREARVRRALLLCHEAFVVSAMSAASTPLGLWAFAHRVAGELPGDSSYASMTLMAAAQPESFTARQLNWIADFLAAQHPAVLPSAGDESAESAWWVLVSGDAAPVSSARRLPPAGSDVRHFSAAPFDHALLARIRQLEVVIADAEDGGEVAAVDMAEVEMLDAEDETLPLGLTPIEILALLRTLRERWLNPPLRTQRRRPHHYVVQVCVGLRALWELARGRPGAGRVLEWQVLNESPGGYAIMNIAGIEAELSSGIVLGLRRPGDTPWTLCVVRWVRSDNPDQVELGLQVLALSYSAVQVAFRGTPLRGVAPALALPVMEPVRRHPAFLAPAGTYASRRFIFLREGTHLYVAQGRALGLDMQTTSVELFQYEIDPYPI